MPRYHFDLQDGAAFVDDEEGTELPDIESAQIEAAETGGRRQRLNLASIRPLRTLPCH